MVDPFFNGVDFRFQEKDGLLQIAPEMIHNGFAVIGTPVPLLRCNELNAVFMRNVHQHVNFFVFFGRGYLAAAGKTDKNLLDFIDITLCCDNIDLEFIKVKADSMIEIQLAVIKESAGCIGMTVDDGNASETQALKPDGRKQAGRTRPDDQHIVGLHELYHLLQNRLVPECVPLFQLLRL